MAAEIAKRSLSEEDVLRAVRWRYRICNYLFNLSGAWILVGFAGTMIMDALNADANVMIVVEFVGLGIFSAAFVLTLAIYRCPVCDQYLSRFRPRREYCPSCGARVREKEMNVGF